MSHPPDRKSFRTGITKSRYGCERCKSKRLKCDEGKPQCKNCIHRDVKCPGYSMKWKWSNKYEKLKPSEHGWRARRKPFSPPTPEEFRKASQKDPKASIDEQTSTVRQESAEFRDNDAQIRELCEAARLAVQRETPTDSDPETACQPNDDIGAGVDRRVVEDKPVESQQGCSQPTPAVSLEQLDDTYRDIDADAFALFDGTFNLPELDPDSMQVNLAFPDIDSMETGHLDADVLLETFSETSANWLLDDVPDLSQGESTNMSKLHLDVPPELFARQSLAYRLAESPSHPEQGIEAAPKVAQDEEGQVSEDIMFLRTELNVPTEASTPVCRAKLASSTKASCPGDLLQWFYRLDSLHYSDADLVEFYFSQTCRVYSLFDSEVNPFRTLVGMHWHNSKAVSLTIQSMACAHLANTVPSMVTMGLAKQRQAISTIQVDLQRLAKGAVSTDLVLLSVFLVGPTTSWHNSGDLGFNFFEIARRLVMDKLNERSPQTGETEREQADFFFNAMIYWEMLMSFVDSRAEKRPICATASPSLAFPGTTLPPTDDLSIQTIQPHPWTGVAAHLHIMLAELARLIRRVLKRGIDATSTDDEERWAASLALALRAAEIPAVGNILDQNDITTPTHDLVHLAEGYRCAGLLQLYHWFPNILRSHLVEVGHYAHDEPPLSPEIHCWWLTRVALKILSFFDRLPTSSGTSHFHPILVMMTGCELKFHRRAFWTSHGGGEQLSSQNRRTVLEARASAESRLTQLAKRLPEKPRFRMLDIMREVWRRSDGNQSSDGGGVGELIHWMQVMQERGWETIMG